MTAVTYSLSAAEPRRFKVLFHVGPELTFRTHVRQGHAVVVHDGFQLADKHEQFFVTADRLRRVTLFRFRGLTRMIKIEHENGTIYMAAIWAMVGQIAFVNFFATGALHRILASLARRS